MRVSNHAGEHWVASGSATVVRARLKFHHPIDNFINSSGSESIFFYRFISLASFARQGFWEAATSDVAEILMQPGRERP